MNAEFAEALQEMGTCLLKRVTPNKDGINGIFSPFLFLQNHVSCGNWWQYMFIFIMDVLDYGRGALSHYNEDFKPTNLTLRKENVVLRL
jgi:hypothetical protein